MSRLAPLEPDSMPPRQRDAYEDLIANQRGGVRGPFGVWVRSPGLVAAMRGLMKFYLEESVITEDIRELTIIITTRHWGATYAYAAHEAQALASGLTPGLVAAVMAQREAHRGRRPRALRSQVLRGITRNPKGVRSPLPGGVFSARGEGRGRPHGPRRLLLGHLLDAQRLRDTTRDVRGGI